MQSVSLIPNPPLADTSRPAGIPRRATLAIAAILLGAWALSWAWAAISLARWSADTDGKLIEPQAALIAANVRTGLSNNDLTSVRRSIMDAGSALSLLRCRIVMPNGDVIADAKPAMITRATLPATWNELGRVFPALPETGHRAADVPIQVDGRGWLRLEIVAGDTAAVSAVPLHAGFGVLGVILIAVSIAVHRRVARRLRPAYEIRQALLALDRGETDLALLQLSASLGDEVRAWNALLQERKETRTSSTSTNLKEGLRRTQSGGNLFAACDALPSGLMVVDANEIVRFANGAAAVMLRLSKPDLAGDPLATLINDERVTAAVRDLLKSDRRRRSTLDIEREDAGSKSCLRFNIRPLRKDDGGGVVITIEDTTQTRAAEAARDTFIAQATHELRTPLTNIRLYTEAAIDAGEDDKLTRTKSLNVINNECRRLERIVGDMLSVSEIEAGSFKIEYAEVRLDAMMDEVAHDFRAQAKEKGVELFFHLPPKLPQARADRDKLVIAIQNLIGNAIKYTPAGGRVDVTVEASARTFTVAVKDTGIGIAPDDVSRLFERFYRASDERVRTITGTGLGLALAREVIRLHGGDVTVESELNKGSTFTLSMPLTAEVAQPC